MPRTAELPATLVKNHEATESEDPVPAAPRRKAAQSSVRIIYTIRQTIHKNGRKLLILNRIETLARSML
jgi:hypothetical protein